MTVKIIRPVFGLDGIYERGVLTTDEKTAQALIKSGCAVEIKVNTRRTTRKKK